jgi:hypothetical protein
LTKDIAHTFHRKDLQAMAHWRKQRFDARLKMALCAILGFGGGCLWQTAQFSAEKARIERAYLEFRGLYREEQ